MKKYLLGLFFFLMCLHTNAALVIVKDSISSNTTWDASSIYLLKGIVYVTSGTILTIESGTIIYGEKATKGTLVIEKGAKILAQGTADLPIIFTSNEPIGSRAHGDWGGVVICGNAPTNWLSGQAQFSGIRSWYGGSNINDNSGVLSYVCIYFGGATSVVNNEMAGLTLCAVGKGTQLDHIQSSYSSNDGFSWFGGNVNAKYLISNSNTDDDYDVSNGYNGMVQFCVASRDPYLAEVASYAFECDSYWAGNTVSGTASNSQSTRPVFSNATVIGPVLTPASTAYNTSCIAAVGVRNGGSLSLLNSIIASFPAGIRLQEPSAAIGSTVANIGSNTLQFSNNIIVGTFAGLGKRNEIIAIPTDTTITGVNWLALSGSIGPWTWLQKPSNNNTIYTNSATTSVQLQAPFTLNHPNFTPKTSSPIVYNSRALPSYIPLGTYPGNVYPFDCNKPINTDTSALFINYNAPSVIPDFVNNNASNSFFTKTNFVGAFGCNDKWMEKWTNFDPINTLYHEGYVPDYEFNSILSLSVYPNPATTNAYVNISLKENTDVQISLVDMTGRKVQDIYTGKTVGSQTYPVNLMNVTAGMYFINVVTNDAHKTIKLTVAK